MNQSPRERQRRHRARRKAAGETRIDVWIPPDVWAALERRMKPEAGYCCPAHLLITLARRVWRLPEPNRDRNSSDQ